MDDAPPIGAGRSYQDVGAADLRDGEEARITLLSGYVTTGIVHREDDGTIWLTGAVSCRPDSVERPVPGGRALFSPEVQRAFVKRVQVKR
jgi:hypothetical protein